MQISYGQQTHEGVQLIGKRITITSDNENYDKYRDTILTITYASNDGNGYDSTMYPEMLCDFKFIDGTPFPFALYEYEFDFLP